MIQLSPEIPQSARAWRNAPEIYRYCRQRTPISEAEHMDWLHSLPTRKDVKMFGVRWDGEPVGVCGLTSIDHINQTAEFSLYIAPDFQRNGYGKDALLALLGVGFHDLNLNRIWGETFEFNMAANMFESIGMVKEGIHRQTYFKEGRFIDSFIYSMLRSEYDAKYGCSANHPAP